MKARYFFYVLLLIMCAFVPFEQSWTWTSGSGSGSDSGSGSFSPPCVEWGSWTVGQSTGSGDAKKTTFITNSEETNGVKIAVKYCAKQPDKSVASIKKFDFKITMNNGFDVEKSVKSTSGPAASDLSPNTTFSIEAKLKGPQDTAKAKKCDGQNGRKNVPMKVTVTFTGVYSTDPNNQKQVTLTKTWTQDGVDLIRQEYVDMTPPDARAELPVPSYGDFVTTISGNGTDRWNTGHYGYMIDDSLKDKKASWLAKVNEYRKSKNLSVVTDNAFKVNSAYRNPYHQRFHVLAPYTASFHSRHCYGDAMDIKTFDVDGDNEVEQKKLRIPKGSTAAQKATLRADAKKNSDDAVELELAAQAAEAKWWGSWEYYSTHTHADWTARGWAKWPPKNGTVYSKPCPGPSGTDNTSTSLTTSTTVACDMQKANNCDVMVSSSTEHYVTCPDSKCGDSYWSCDSYDYDEHRLRTCTWERLPLGAPCGKSWRSCEYTPEKISGTQYSVRSPKCVTDPNGTRHCAENGVKTAPSNEDNTPDQNVPISPVYHSCGIHQTHESGNHSLQASCSETDSQGQYCTETNYYACQYHTHQYPALITGACGHSYTASSSYSHRSESCPTNSNGDSCSSGSYYVCKSHSHQYPPPKRTCWRADCDVEVTNAADHKAACGSGNHSYWPGCPDLSVRWWHQRTTHAEITCKRCGVKFRPCSNTKTCKNGWGHKK